MTQKICDICGKPINPGIEYKVKVKRKAWDWGEPIWERLDLCERCNEILFCKPWEENNGSKN